MPYDEEIEVKIRDDDQNEDTLKLENTISVEQLKVEIGKKKSLEPEKLQLKYKNKVMKDETSLASVHNYWKDDSIDYKIKKK